MTSRGECRRRLAVLEVAAGGEAAILAWLVATDPFLTPLLLLQIYPP